MRMINKSCIKESRKKIPIILLGFIALVSCSKRPANVLSEDKMVDLMADMAIAESYVSQQPGTSGQERVEMGERVLEIHGVKPETLDTTLAWYGRNLDEYTQLFERVDKEINKRRLKYSDIPVENLADANNLWPFSKHLLVSELSGGNSFVFSIPSPVMGLGDIVRLSFTMANPTSLKGILGVEYDDGTGESILTTYSGKSRFEIDLQSDTAKAVARLYGILDFKEIEKLPVYIDSVSITLQPIDSTTYRQKMRSQKHYDLLRPRKIEVVKKDTIASDTIPLSDSLRINDSIPALDTQLEAPSPNGHTINERAKDRAPIPMRGKEPQRNVMPK